MADAAANTSWESVFQTGIAEAAHAYTTNHFKPHDPGLTQNNNQGQPINAATQTVVQPPAKVGGISTRAIEIGSVVLVVVVVLAVVLIRGK